MRSTLEVGALADGFGGIFGDEAGFGEGFGGGDFDGEPGAESVFVAPDAGHLRAGVAWDHGSSCTGLRILNGEQRYGLGRQKPFTTEGTGEHGGRKSSTTKGTKVHEGRQARANYRCYIADTI